MASARTGLGSMYSNFIDLALTVSIRSMNHVHSYCLVYMTLLVLATGRYTHASHQTPLEINLNVYSRRREIGLSTNEKIAGNSVDQRRSLQPLNPLRQTLLGRDKIRLTIEFSQ